MSTNQLTDATLIQKIKLQQELSARLKSLVKDEMELRREIALELLNGKEAGTHHFFSENLKVTAVKAYDYTLDQKLVKEYMELNEFSPEELNAITIKYNLSLTAYKKIPLAPMLDDCITAKEKAPQISVEEF